MKNIRKRIFALGCIGLLLTGMSGCGKKAEEKNETVLEVVTDPSIQNEVKDVADFMMKTENIEINMVLVNKCVGTTYKGRYFSVHYCQKQAYQHKC